MLNEETRDYILDFVGANDEKCLDEDKPHFFNNPSFDNSIVGVSVDNRVIYDYDLMVEELAKDDDITEEEAMEFIDYNTLRTLPYINEEDGIPPIIYFPIMK